MGADTEAIETWKNLFKKAGIDAEVGEEYDFKNSAFYITVGYSVFL